MDKSRDNVTFFRCQCFLTKNFYSNRLKKHVYFVNEVQFRNDYRKVLIDQHLTEEDILNVLEELETERGRRKTIQEQSLKRSRAITENYTPLHQSVYKLQEEFLDPKFVELVEYSKTPTAKTLDLLSRLEGYPGRVYSFPVFTQVFCYTLLQELDHFQMSGLDVGRPNTMNNYGLLLGEIGLNEGLISPLRRNYLLPVCRLIYPEWVGESLDSHKAFTVQYKDGGDAFLSNHYDNAEITMNVCLGRHFEEGSLFFGRMRTEPQSDTDMLEVRHKICHGVLHRGQHMHGAMPLEDGERVNLIIWMRSSKIRNLNCPMCDQVPDLTKAVGFGDGFTQDTVNVCHLL